MLQSLLQPRYNNRHDTMISALPAVAVRRERRRGEKRARRPSQLQLQLGRLGDCEPTPSPDHGGLRDELYVCGKVAGLYAVVGSLLLGIVVLVVGLVQLSPGAEAAQHRYYLIISGAGLIGIGIFGAFFRCLCLHWLDREFIEEVREVPVHKNGVSLVESGHKHGHKATQSTHKDAHGHDGKDRPKLKPQASRDQGPTDFIKQSSTTSET